MYIYSYVFNNRNDLFLDAGIDLLIKIYSVTNETLSFIPMQWQYLII